MKEKKKRMNKWMNGFTLVELIVVLVILSVLSAVAVPTVLGYIDDSKAKECRTQVEALTAEISSAKMAAEVNGEEGGTVFDVQAYINAAGDSGKCPVDGNTAYQYIEGENKIICPNKHGEGIISGSGKFTVVVKPNEDKRESPDEPEPSTPEGSNPPEENTSHSYTFKINPDTSLENMEVGGQGASLTVTVYDEKGNIVPSDKVNVEWHYPGCVNGPENGVQASVEAVQEGNGDISCTVTVKDGKENIPATGDSVHVSVKAEEEEHELHLSGPESLRMKEDTSQNLGMTAKDERGDTYPEIVYYTFESNDPSGLSVDSDGTLHAHRAGTYTVTVTAQDGEKTDTRTVTVTVDPLALYIELTLTPSLVLKIDEKGTLTATAVVRNEKREEQDVPVTFTWQKDETVDGIAEVTVDSEKRTAEVIGKKVGSGTVTVTATAEGAGSATATATIVVPKESGTRLKASALLWAEDRGDVTPVNIRESDFLDWFIEKPASNKDGRWSSSSEGVNIIQGWNDAFEITATISNWKEGNEYVFVYTPVNGEPESIVITVGYSIDKISQLHYTPNDRKNFEVGEQLDIEAAPDPPLTTDNLQWEIIQTDGKEDHATLQVNDLPKGKKATLTMTSPGEFQVRVFSERERDGKIREIYSDKITVTGEEPIESENYPKGELMADGKRFRATSWKEFQKAVEDNQSYKNNRNWDGSNPAERDSPIYYDDVKDEKGNIIGRRYYVALGTDNNYSGEEKREDVKISDSFEAFTKTSKGKDEFIEIKGEFIKNIPTFSESEARNSDIKYELGTIVKIKFDDGTEKYYIANIDSESKRELRDIFEAKGENGWWRLDILL